MNLQELLKIHDMLTEAAKEKKIEKSPSYAPEEDALEHYKSTGREISPMQGILVRIRDELRTLERLERSVGLNQEDVRSAVKNLINYEIDAYCLLKEKSEEGSD